MTNVAILQFFRAAFLQLYEKYGIVDRCKLEISEQMTLENPTIGAYFRESDFLKPAALWEPEEI